MNIFLKDILQEKKMSVNELHKLTGISRTTLDPLSKTNELPLKTRFETIQRISDSLKVPVNEIITFQELDDTSFTVEIIDRFSYDFDAFLLEYYELFLVRVTNKNSQSFILVLSVTSSPDDYFKLKYNSKIKRLNNLFNVMRGKEDNEKKNDDSEFKSIYNSLKEDALVYNGKKVYSTQNAFVFFDAVNHEPFKNKFIDSYKTSSPLHSIIGNDNFINSVSTYFANFFNLKDNVTNQYLESWETRETDPKKRLVETDFVIFRYCSDDNHIEKEIFHTYFYN